jgi:hypothetical protein
MLGASDMTNVRYRDFLRLDVEGQNIVIDTNKNSS